MSDKRKNPIQAPQSQKKEFNKRKWREKKYSKKTALDSFKSQNEKKMQRNYFKLIKKESRKTAAINRGENPNLEPLGEKGGKMAELVQKEKDRQEKEEDASKRAKAQSYSAAKMEFKLRQKEAEKKVKMEEKKRKYLERSAALKAYKEKKAQRFKTLSQKNRKGQPIMAGRLEMLLQKIKDGDNN